MEHGGRGWEKKGRWGRSEEKGSGDKSRKRKGVKGRLETKQVKKGA